jgi:hypothetical protein
MSPRPGPVGSAVVPLGGVDLARSFAPPWRRRAARRNVIEDGCEHGGVGGGQPLRSAAAHRRPRPGGACSQACQDRLDLCPRGSLALGAHAHGVHTRPRPVHPALLAQRVQTSRWRAPNISASAHSVSRRQQVAGEPQPSSRAGSSRQGSRRADGVPECMAESTARNPGGRSWRLARPDGARIQGWSCRGCER